jgi:hypothetical protein
MQLCHGQVIRCYIYMFEVQQLYDYMCHSRGIQKVLYYFIFFNKILNLIH